jgi:hypothetical protein
MNLRNQTSYVLPKYDSGHEGEIRWIMFKVSLSKSQKRAGGLAQGVGPEFKYQYCKKRKKK